MARRRSPADQAGSERRALRTIVGTATIGVLSLVAVGVSTSATVAADDTRSDAAIVECRSGVVTDGDISMSSLTVTRVATAPHDLPGGCRVVP